MPLLLGGLMVWARRSPAAWVGGLALASLWPILERAREVGLLPASAADSEFGQLAWLGSVVGATTGLAWLDRQAASNWLLSTRGCWLAESAVLVVCGTLGALLAAGLAGLELGAPLLTVAAMVLVHAFLGLTLRRALPGGLRRPMALVGLVWLLPAIGPQALGASLSVLAMTADQVRPERAGLAGLAALGWLLLSGLGPLTPPRLRTRPHP